MHTVHGSDALVTENRMVTWLAKRRETLVVSLESFSIALMICSIGVMPGGEGREGEGREEGRREGGREKGGRKEEWRKGEGRKEKGGERGRKGEGREEGRRG